MPPDGQGGYNISVTAATAAGHRVVRSAGYYLDQLGDTDPDGRHHGTCEHSENTASCRALGVLQCPLNSGRDVVFLCRLGLLRG